MKNIQSAKDCMKDILEERLSIRKKGMDLVFLCLMQIQNILIH